MHNALLTRSKLLLAASAVTAGAVVTGLMPADASSPAARSTATDSSMVTSMASGKGSITSHVRGTFGKAGTVRGTFTPIRSIVRGGNPYVVGTLHATLRRANGTKVGTTNRQVALPIRNATNPSARPATGTSAKAAQQADCAILHLVLGPLDLNLLGLKVHLDRVVLNIDAAPGAGQLLGNLLCAVAGLLDQTGLLNALKLVNALNRILTILKV